MKFAIIAAGEGSRLAHEGVAVPKPLVRVGGEALVERLVRIFGNNGADETVVIVNTIHPATGQFVRAMQERMEPGRPYTLKNGDGFCVYTQKYRFKVVIET